MADRSGAGSQMVALGRIVNTHGIRGELRLLPYNPSTEICVAGACLVVHEGDQRRELVVSTARRHKNFILLTFADVGSIEAAEPLVGAEVEIPAAALPAPHEGETYHFDLIGLTAVTTTGVELGVVEQVFSTGAHDVCVVRRDGREILVPYIDDVICEVDVEGGRLVIEPLPGLLD